MTDRPRRFDRVRQIMRAIGEAVRPRQQQLATVDGSRSWFTIFDWKPGAWQQDATPVNLDRAMTNWAIYSCLSLISSDIGKLRLKLVERQDNGIWEETQSSAFGPVLRKPNGYQTRKKFFESWVLSKLGPAGNTYVFKERDRRGIVTAMHVLDPTRCRPLIAPNGAVFYELREDTLAQIPRDPSVSDGIVRVPASEIIHDRAACLFHPLVGISPMYACALAALQGLSIQRAQEDFFDNRAMPGGIITAPGEISDELAEDLKTQWQARYAGENAGKTAVLTEGLKYEPLSLNQKDSQVTEQLGITAKMICAAYHVPPFKIGLETLPVGQKVEDMNRVYYADCLQTLIEDIEGLLDEGLGLTLAFRLLGTEFDLEDLLRMDSATQIDSLGKAVKDGWMAPNEARAKRDLPPVTGGESPMMQQQNWNLEQLAEREAPNDRAAVAPPPPATREAPAADNPDDSAVEDALDALAARLPRLIEEAA